MYSQILISILILFQKAKYVAKIINNTTNDWLGKYFYSSFHGKSSQIWIALPRHTKIYYLCNKKQMTQVWISAAVYEFHMAPVPYEIHSYFIHSGGVSECRTRDQADAEGGFDE